MGYLTAQLYDDTSRLSQERGRQYFSRGAVKRIEGDALSVNAVVQGSMRYDVTISHIDEFLDYSCTCMYYEREFDPCKHIWATCLAAEQEGYLTGRELAEIAPVSFRTKAKPRTDGKNPPAPPSWKKQLQPLLSAMEAEENRLRFAAAPERELVYLIDTDATLARERLVVEVAQRDKKMNGTWGKLKSKSSA
jgi:hypothetical protein